MASSVPMGRLSTRLARRQARLINLTKRYQTTSVSTPPSQNPVYPLYPSVTNLLHEHGIPDSEIPRIPATGPKGRLLKGDVLAYLGSITAGYPAVQAQRIAKLAHLDLLNIKVALPRRLAEEPAPAPASPSAVAGEAASPRALPAGASVAVSISLASVLSVQKRIQDSLGITVPLSTFIERAANLANQELPRSALTPPSTDELFDEILGASPITTSRGNYVPEINTVPASSTASSPPDIIDFLSGKVTSARRVAPTTSIIEPTQAGSAMNVFSLTIPVGDERRAKVFLDRIRSFLQVDPGQLVL